MTPAETLDGVGLDREKTFDSYAVQKGDVIEMECPATHLLMTILSAPRRFDDGRCIADQEPLGGHRKSRHANAPACTVILGDGHGEIRSWITNIVRPGVGVIFSRKEPTAPMLEVLMAKLPVPALPPLKGRQKGQWRTRPKPCPVCGKKVKNLGPHLRSHPDAAALLAHSGRGGA